MKLKVQAQRKFAQGAFIPPSVSANPVERRVDVTPSKDENKNVYYNRMSAVSLLDIVAFQNMHSHTEPVVLLERLEELQDSANQPAEVNGTLPGPLTNGTATAHSLSIAKSKPARPLRYIRPKRTGGLNQRAQRPQSMHLRSRLGPSFKPKTSVGARRLAAPVARALRRRVPSPATSVDLDDDKPLTFIAQALRGTAARRKRRGDDLTSTSKRRTRVPIPTRPQKPSKPRAPAAPPKVSRGSDSDDTDTGSTKDPPKSAVKSRKASSGFRVNEGASTSKNTDTPSRRELAHRLTDAGRTASPRSVTSSDVSTRSQKIHRTPSGGTSRVLSKTKKDARILKGNLLARPMSESKIKLNKIKSARSAVHNKIILESRTGTRAQRRIKKDLNLRATCPKKEAQNNDRDFKAHSAPSSNQHKDQNNRSTLRNQATTTKESGSQALATQNDNLGDSSTKNHPNDSRNELEQKNISQGQPSRKNDHKLRSSSRPQPATKTNEDKTDSHAQSTSLNINNNLKSTEVSQTSQNIDHKLRSGGRAQPVSQNNDLKLRSSLRGLSTSQTNDPDRLQVAQSTSNDSGNKSMPTQSTTQSSTMDPVNSTQSQQNKDNITSNYRAQSKMRSGTRILFASKYNPYYFKNSSQQRYQNPSQSNLTLGGNRRAGSTSHDNNTESSASQVRPSLRISGPEPGSSSRPQMPDQSNGPGSSTQVPPMQVGEIVRSIIQTPSTSRNIEPIPHSSTTQPTVPNIDLDLFRSIQVPSTSRDNTPRNVAHVLPIIRSNPPQNTSQSQPSGLNNDPRNSTDPPTNQSTDSNAGETSSQPTIRNNTATRTTIRVDDVELRRNLRQVLMNDLDLRVHSRPLSAIQNFDFDFSGSRNSPRFHNNLLGLRRDIIRARNAARNDNNQQQTNATNPRVELTVRNDLTLGRLLPSFRNTDVAPRAPATSLRINEQEPSTSTARPSTQSDPLLGSTSLASILNDLPSTNSRSRPLSGIDLGSSTNTRQRPTIRNDSFNVGGRWVMRPSFRHDSYGHRVRSTLLNDEIRPRPRIRPLARTGDLDLRVPIQPVRDQARCWNLESNGDRTREQQQRAESMAVINRATRAERIAAATADRERAMTLDDALRECVLTAQTVTAEVKRMQRRQAIAARQQQLAERSPLSHRNLTRRVTHTETSATISHRAPERQLALTPPPEGESDPKPGPSRVRRKRQTSSPSEPGCSPRTRSSGSESEPLKEAQTESELSKLRRKKSLLGDATASSPRQEKESEQQPETQPQSGTDAEPAPSKVRKTKSTTSPGDAELRYSDSEREPQPGPSKLRRRKWPTLLGMMQRSRRTPEWLPEKSVLADRGTGTKPQEVPKDTTTKTTEDSTNTSTAINSRLNPGVEPATDRSDIEIPADKLAQCPTTRRPIVEGWLRNVLLGTEEGSPHFKVPRIPAARKSTERRSKSQGSERDDTQTPPEPHPTTPVEEEQTTSSKAFTACPKRDLPFPSRENLVEPIIQPKSACLSKHYTTVRSIVHATDSELSDRCGHCIYCTRVDKIRKLSNLVQNQRKPAATNEVYDFDADREDSHENTRLYNFRQNRKAKLLEPSKDPPKDPVYLDVLPPQNPHIIEITSVPMPNQNKPMLRARLIRKTDANLENEFSLNEHENLLDQLLEIKIANTDQTKDNAKKPAPVETEEAVPGPSNAEPTPEVTDSTEDVELNYETDDSSEFLARLQTRLNTRRRTEQTSVRAKEKPGLSKKKTDVKKAEPVKKTKGVKKNQDEVIHVEPPRKALNDNLSSCFREAPVFRPTEEEFLDPLAYFEKIYPVASQFGLCKVVAPSGFKPKCTITDDVRFNVANQYISRLYCRWGAASKEMCAIKAYLAEQKVFFTRPPLIEGIELNLPKLYRTVQRHGGLKKVIEKKRWGRVAEDMQFPRGPRSAKRIDQLYVKHLLPYDTLSSAERRELMDTVENSWNRNYKKMLSRASNPLHRQKRLMGESESSDEVDTDEDANLAYALAEAEDCVVTGRCMKLSVFKKVASNVMCTLFPHSEQPSPKEVEEEYWTLVSGAAEHVCVNAASIDTGEEGYGFPRAKHDPYSKHPWNLKMFSQNDGNVLRSLGPVLGVTVPTLHLGMVFSTSCWHRDPHGLPWVEYMHQGPPKIWYGIPDELSSDFRKAVETLCPTSCQNKSIWLPSDITMIPPQLLREAQVPLSRAVQSPGEFVLVCPKAYSSSIATGYTESESVYFAPTQWLADVSDVFQELRDSCEPTMFSLSQLLLAVALDARTPVHLLARVLANLRDIVRAELARRDALERAGVELTAPEQNRASCGQARKRPAGAWNVREQDECEVCRATLYLSKVTGLTSKRSSLCLEHALLLIDKDKKRYARDVSGVVATIFVLRAELEDAVARVERRLNE